VVDFLKQSQSELPFITVALIGTSNFFINYWYLVVSVPVVAFIGLKLMARTSEDFAFWLDAQLLRLPVIGPVVRKIALSRFAHFFAVMFQSGIEILKCLESSKGVVGNRALAESIGIVQQSVRAGNRFSAALLNSGEFPNLVVRMVKVGEDTGALTTTLEQVTEFYDREVNDSIDAMIGSIEPILTMTVGLILAWVVAAVFGPLYDNLGALTAG
jgi:type IV pilus assembly protein PilC